MELGGLSERVTGGFATTSANCSAHPQTFGRRIKLLVLRNH